MNTPNINDPLVIAGKPYRSRLLTGTGKFTDFTQTRLATDAAGAEIVTVALRRTNLGQNKGEPNLLDFLPPCCPIPPDAMTPMMRCAPASSPANCWTATDW